MRMMYVYVHVHCLCVYAYAYVYVHGLFYVHVRGVCTVYVHGVCVGLCARWLFLHLVYYRNSFHYTRMYACTHSRIN